jgi:GT2 family glycosyltransferase
MMKETLAIIIVTWNSEADIDACLDSLRRSEVHVPIRVVVVDNASTDGTAELVRTEHPWCQLIVNSSNVGFAAANNIALGFTTSDFVMLLNPDTVVEPGTIDRLIGYLARNPSVGVVGPRLLNGDGTIQPSVLSFPTLIGNLLSFWQVAVLKSSLKSAPEAEGTEAVLVDVVSGACMLIRQALLDQVGFLDDEFFLCGEEVDLCYRIKSAGFKIAYLPSAGVVHRGGRSMAKASLVSFVERRRGRILFMLKHCGKPEAFLEMLLIEALTLMRALLKPGDRGYYLEALKLFRARTHPLFFARSFSRLRS